MKCGQVHQSIEAWRKLSNIPLRPQVGLKILRYSKLITAEYDVIEKQRIVAIREVAGVEEGEDVQIPPDSPKFAKCVERINELMQEDSTLPLLELDLETVIDTLDGKDNILSVSDLAVLEPFFELRDEVLDVEVIT